MQTDNGGSSSSLFMASKLTIEMGITTIVTAKSLNPILTMRLFPVFVWMIKTWNIYDYLSIFMVDLKMFSKCQINWGQSNKHGSLMNSNPSPSEFLVNKPININYDSIRIYVPPNFPFFCSLFLGDGGSVWVAHPWKM